MPTGSSTSTVSPYSASPVDRVQRRRHHDTSFLSLKFSRAVCAHPSLQSPSTPSPHTHKHRHKPWLNPPAWPALLFFLRFGSGPRRASTFCSFQLRHGSTPSSTSREQSQHGLEKRGGQTTGGQGQAVGGARGAGVGKRRRRRRQQSAHTPIRPKGDASGHWGCPCRGCRGHRPSVPHQSRYSSRYRPLVGVLFAVSAVLCSNVVAKPRRLEIECRTTLCTSNK